MSVILHLDLTLKYYTSVLTGSFGHVIIMNMVRLSAETLPVITADIKKLSGDISVFTAVVTSVYCFVQH